MNGRQNEIHRLDKVTTDKKNYKPIFIISLILLVGAILLLIIFKDSFKLNSIDTFEESDEVLYNKKIEINFTDINIISDFANIYIEKTADDYATVNIYGESAKAKVNIDGDALAIDLNLKCTVCHGVKSGKIFISIPEDKIDEINITNEYGSIVSDNFDFSINADVSYGNFSATSLDKLDLELTSGNIKISELNDARINVDIGNVTINTIKNYADINSNLGNIIITDMPIKKESSLYAASGSIVVVNALDYNYVAKSENGIISLPDDIDDSKIKINLKTGKGNISVGE